MERIEYLLTSLKNFNMYENLQIKTMRCRLRSWRSSCRWWPPTWKKKALSFRWKRLPGLERWPPIPGRCSRRC